jgi:hypothetical protein
VTKNGRFNGTVWPD